MPLLDRYFSRLSCRPPWRWGGRVVEAVGHTVESAGPLCSVGECCEIFDGFGHKHLVEVIGFRGNHVLSMPLESSDGIRYGDPITGMGIAPQIEVGDALMGRVLNAMGEPIDNGRRPVVDTLMPLDSGVRKPLERVPIRTALGTGVRVVDGLLTVGRGQRVGIFGGSGVGKSTLIGMMTRNTQADVTVVGLVGERGREVVEFLEDSLGEEGLRRSVVLVSTSDESPLMRMRAALATTSVAEYFAAQGKHVLLVLDSLTRFAMAAREIGLSAGEPPTAKGYTPSVFSRMAKLVERTGQFQQGSITAFYTVLMEGDDQQDPIVDAVRSLLDGHVMLSRDLASEGMYPPVNLLDSISRLMPAVITPKQKEQAALIRKLMAVYARSEDLIRIGAYKPGTDPELDRAIRGLGAIRNFLKQDSKDAVSFPQVLTQLEALAAGV
jgi:flagellum-specific ATP synthase